MASRDATRPNVLLVLSDDQGPWALGSAGNDEIHTPHLDQLASQGVRLTRFFCTSPVCSPARASLFTGELPSQHGVHDWISDRHAGEQGLDFLAGRRMFTDDLADAGWELGLVGKWHLGANDQPRRGFEHWFAYETGGGPYWNAPMYRNGKRTQEDRYLTDILTDDACARLEEVAGPESDGRPFYLSLHYTAPHKPWRGQHPEVWTELYEDCAFTSCPQGAAHPWQPLDDDGVPVGGEADTRQALIGYFAAVSAMDDGIGQVLHTLERLGLDSSTLVVFSSDNGFNCGHHGIWGKGNGTYPQNMYDSSVLVPMLLRLPGRLPAGRVDDTLLSAYDFRSTLLDLLGIDYEPDPRLPGRSFATLLTDSEPAGQAPRGGTGQDDAGEDPRAGVVVYDEYGPVRMIRTRRWKYVHRYPDGPHELYDLVADPGETRDLAAASSHAEVRDALSARLDAWFARYVTDPRRDGVLLPVTGNGQSDLASFVPAPPHWDPWPGRTPGTSPGHG